MQVSWPDFTPATFSFHDDPVLVVENCWTAVERRQFRNAMERSSWQLLHERAWRPRCLPQLRELAQRAHGLSEGRPAARTAPFSLH